MRNKPTCDTNTVDVLRLNAFTLKDVVHLWTSAVQDNWIEAQAVKEAKAESKLIEVIEDCTAKLDDGEFCGLGWMRRGREDAKVTFDFTLCTEGVEQASNRVLRTCQDSTAIAELKKTDSVGLSNRLDGPDRFFTTDGSLATTSDDSGSRGHGQSGRQQ